MLKGLLCLFERMKCFGLCLSAKLVNIVQINKHNF